MTDLTSPQRLANYTAFPGGHPVQIVPGSGTRVNATASSSASSAALVPAGGNVMIIRAVDNIWINFGGASVAAAADNTSILFPTGESYYPLKQGETYFSVLRVGSADVTVQLESSATL